MEIKFPLKVESLGTKIEGYLVFEDQKTQEKIKFHFNPFLLDLEKGTQLVENRRFSTFWD